MKNLKRTTAFVAVFCLFFVSIIACNDVMLPTPPNPDDSGGEAGAVVSVTIDPAEITLDVGDKKALTTKILPEDATEKRLRWVSANPAVASVNDGGSVTAISAGTAVITAITVDGQKTASCIVKVGAGGQTGAIPVTGVSFDEPVVKIDLNGIRTRQLSYKITPEGASNTALIWVSSISAVADVNDEGIVTAETTGTAIITVLTVDGGKTASCVVQVTKNGEAVPSPVTGISLDTTNITLDLNGTTEQTLTAFVTPADAKNKTVYWASNAPGIASVIPGENNTATVIAQGAGTTTISVVTDDGGRMASCVVTVKGTGGDSPSTDIVPVESVRLNSTDISLSKGDEFKLIATVEPSNATNKTVTWHSNSNIVSVDETGNVTALLPGEATIFAAVGEKEAACTVTVTDSGSTPPGGGDEPVSAITLNSTAITLSKNYSLHVLYVTNAVNQKVNWASDDTNVANVDSDGVVTAKGVGTAVVTASVENSAIRKGTCTVTVESIPGSEGTKVANVTISQTLLTLAIDGDSEEQLFATIMPTNATNKGLIWTTSNPYVATVSANGLVKAVGAGQALVTVTTVDGGKQASCVVNVTSTVKAPIPGGAAIPGSGEITVEWDLPTGDDYAKAIITLSASGYSEVQEVTRPGTSCTFTALTNGKPYTVKIKAVYANGESSAENILDGIIPADVVPVTARNLDMMIGTPGLVTNNAVTPAIIIYPNISPSIIGYTGFSHVTCSWSDPLGVTMSSSQRFGAGTVYKATLKITAADGYHFRGLAANAFTHSGASLVNAVYSNNYTVATVTITFPATPTVTIKGKIYGPAGGADTATGGGLKQARVTLNGVGSHAPVVTDNEGIYTFTNVAAGNYTITTSKTDGAGYGSTTGGSFSVSATNVDTSTAAANTTTNLTLSLAVLERDFTNMLYIPYAMTIPAGKVPTFSPTQYTVSVSWREGNSGSNYTSNFKPGQTYTAIVTLNSSTTGRSFSGLTKADFTYGGLPNETTWDFTPAADGKSATVTVRFPETGWNIVYDYEIPGGSLAEKLAYIKTNEEAIQGTNYVFTITDTVELVPQTFNVRSMSKLINTNLTFTGGGTIKLPSDRSGSLFSLTGYSAQQTMVLTLDNITLEGKGTEETDSTNSAPLVYVTGYVIVDMKNNSKITGNKTTGNGGGVYVTNSSTFTMNDSSTISGNTVTIIASSSPYGGGGVYVTNSSTFIMNDSSTISGNKATFSPWPNSSSASYINGGGGVYVNGVTFTMNDSSTISGNTATFSYPGANGYGGGGVYANGTFTMNNNSTISGNKATSSYGGGGVYNASSFTMNNNSTISGNTAESTSTYATSYNGGGGVYNASRFTMKGGTISNNTASGKTSAAGGGVYTTGSTFLKEGGTIHGSNEAAGTANKAIITDTGLVTGTVTGTGRGHAAANDYDKRDNTAGLLDNMSNVVGPQGGWDG